MTAATPVAALALVVLLALAVVALVLVLLRADRLYAATVRRLEADVSQRAARVVDLERMLDEVRAMAAGVPARAAVTVAGEAVELPRSVQRQLAAIEDDSARADMEELLRYRIAQGESADAAAAEVFDA